MHWRCQQNSVLPAEGHPPCRPIPDRARLRERFLGKNENMMRLGLSVCFIWFVVDQVTKWWIVTHLMHPPRVIPITSFFNIVLGRNTGVSFGLLGDASPWLLVAIAAAIVTMLLIWMRRAESRVSGVALGLISGGAAGNVVDRLRHGGVTDFLDFYLGEWHWPAFNMADVGVVCGAVLLLVESLIFENHVKRDGRDVSPG